MRVCIRLLQNADFFEALLKLQSRRLDEQRCDLPASNDDQVGYRKYYANLRWR